MLGKKINEKKKKVRGRREQEERGRRGGKAPVGQWNWYGIPDPGEPGPKAPPHPARRSGPPGAGVLRFK